jgi:hypothetical protein
LPAQQHAMIHKQPTAAAAAVGQPLLQRQLEPVAARHAVACNTRDDNHPRGRCKQPTAAAAIGQPSQQALCRHKTLQEPGCSTIQMCASLLRSWAQAQHTSYPLTTIIIRPTASQCTNTAAVLLHTDSTLNERERSNVGPVNICDGLSHPS